MILGESRQTYWLEIIEKELEKLESGDMRALLTVYCAFAVGDKKLRGPILDRDGMLWFRVGKLYFVADDRAL